MLGNLYHAVWVEIETYHSIVGFGVFRLLFNTETVAVLVELSHAVALGIIYIITEHCSKTMFLCILNTLTQQTCET